MEKLNGLDLFSGIGGITKALEEWVRPIAYCECDRYAQAVLLSRMQSGDLPLAPIWNDVQSLPADLPTSGINIIYGGFPCQDISTAGAGKGLEGERSSLFFEIVRLAKEIKPEFLFLENVAAIRTRGLDQVIEQLTEVGYDLRWLTISAAAIGAEHKRERWFLLAHTTGKGREGSIENRKVFGGEGAAQSYSRSASPNEWLALDTNRPSLRVDDGIPLTMDRHRLHALGNAVVPQQAKEAFKILMGL